MRILVAMDKFRGTLTTREACAAVAAGVRSAGHEPVCVPLSDGGEGFVDSLGGANRTTTATGPQGIPVAARWRLHETRAVIESAAASGAALLDESRPRDAVAATSRGTGELIAAALDAGAQEIWVGIGGTACSDGGEGALDALESRLHPGPPASIPARLAVFVDVSTRFADAGRVFGPQKGATPDEVTVISARLQRLALTYLERYGRDIAGLDGAGAGGGLAGGLAAIGGEIRGGFTAIAAATDLEARLREADVVITGEGRFDASSLDGKVVGGVLSLAAEHGVRALVIAGDVDQEAAARDSAGIETDITARSLTIECGRERAWADTAAALSEVARGLLM